MNSLVLNCYMIYYLTQFGVVQSYSILLLSYFVAAVWVAWIGLARVSATAPAWSNKDIAFLCLGTFCCSHTCVYCHDMQVYMGLHTPVDILGGVISGLLVLTFYASFDGALATVCTSWCSQYDIASMVYLQPPLSDGS